ncbi:18319_t:CDS:2, partial [Racocetra persica]
KEKRSSLVMEFWESITSSQKRKFAAISERTTVMFREVFSCEHQISTKFDLQNIDYKVYDVAELFEKPRQIHL